MAHDEMSHRPIQEVLADHTEALMSIPGVIGTAQSICDDADCIKVYVEEMTDTIRERVPEMLEGYRVRVDVSGAFEARGN